MRTQLNNVVPVISVMLIVLSGCQTPEQEKAAQNTRVNHQAAQEIQRICALHGDARKTELEKLKQQSGLELYCPDE